METAKTPKYNYTMTANDYKTPPVLYEKALEFINQDFFTCDVCCSEKNIPAIIHYVEGKENGLIEDWFQFNWCNPPFNECSKWIKKAYEEQLKGNVTCMLLPVRTETRYWHDYILYNPNIYIDWLRKGYKFLNQDNKEMGVFKNALALVYFLAY